MGERLHLAYLSTVRNWDASNLGQQACRLHGFPIVLAITLSSSSAPTVIRPIAGCATDVSLLAALSLGLPCSQIRCLQIQLSSTSAGENVLHSALSACSGPSNGYFFLARQRVVCVVCSASVSCKLACIFARYWYKVAVLRARFCCQVFLLSWAPVLLQPGSTVYQTS